MPDTTPPARAFGRSLPDFVPLTPAEQKLLEAVRRGEVAAIAATRPAAKKDDNVVRAGFIRFLALGGDEGAPVHERGVLLLGAFIEGIFDLIDCTTVCSVMLLKCQFEHAPTLVGAVVHGSLLFDGSQLPGLQADRLRVEGDVGMGDGFRSMGEVRLSSAKIVGNWICDGGIFNNPDGVALKADVIEVGGVVRLAAGFQSSGAVLLRMAKIGGQWVCDGGIFNNPQGDALSADGIEVDGSVSMGAGFSATGAVRLLGAEIGGQWVCDGGIFNNPQGDALSADGIEVTGNVLMGAGFSAKGAVRLLGAKIGGQWVCDGGIFNNSDGAALSADGIKVSGDVRIGSGFQSIGEVRLRGSKIGSNLSALNGRFTLLTLECAEVQGILFLNPIGDKRFIINLAAARVAVLHDTANKWPDRIYLTGFVYDSFGEGAPVGGKDRISWLDRQPEGRAGDSTRPDAFTPQPWLQARKVLREMGHYEAAREVGIAFETRKRKIGLIGGTSETVPRWCPAFAWSGWRWLYQGVAKFLHSIYWALASYGYRPLKLLIISVAVWLVCAGLYLAGSNNGVFAPTNPAIYQNPAYAVCRGTVRKHPIWTRCAALPAEYTTFNSLAYSLNVLLPVGDLGQVGSWAPMTSTRLGKLVQIVVWAETLFGWVASLLLVAVLSGLTKRDE